MFVVDSDVIRLISIRGNINSELGERDDGDFSTEVQDPSQGRWTFVDRNTRFSVGDKIYFRLTIRVDSNGETIEVPKDLEYTVNSKYLRRHWLHAIHHKIKKKVPTYATTFIGLRQARQKSRPMFLCLDLS